MDPARYGYLGHGLHSSNRIGKTSHGLNGNRKCIVDLTGVTFVDLNGERMLATMMKEGAEFIATGVYTKHLLEMLEKRRYRWIRKFSG